MTHPAAPHPYSTRRRELRQLTRTLSEASPAEASTAAPGLLMTAGDLMRRMRAADGVSAEIDAALRAIPGEAMRAWLQSVDLRECAEAVDRAASEAVEAAMADSDDERELWATSAATALGVRDRLQSAKQALARWVDLGGALGDGGAAARDRLETALAELDERGRSSKARWLVGINQARRAERDLLDPEQRDAAWWFSSRAGCDELIVVLSGGVGPTRHVDSCTECRHDLRVSRVIDAPPAWHLRSDDRLRFEAGLVSAEERRRIEAHVARCAPCADALRISDEIERALLEA